MQIEVLKSKLHCVTVTEANLNYMGSITIDEDLMDAANLIAGEKVQIVDNNNGERLETYIIKGERGSGCICLYNYDCLKSIHAEAMDKIGDTYDKYLSMFSLIVSVLSFIVAALALIITIVHEKGLLIVVAIIVYLFFLLIISVLFMKFINASRSVSHWQKYVVEAVEDILDDMKNEKDNRKEVHLPDNLYEILDNLETKVDLPDRLYNQLDSIEKASSENPLKKIISKK